MASKKSKSQQAKSKASEEFKDSPSEVCATCDKCGPLLDKINSLMAEIKRRRIDMRVDKEELYKIRPGKKPGIGSWPGHIQQFENKQAQLRTTLAKARENGCPVPPDADKTASEDPPSRPDRKRG
jgi:hypothetical protein